MDLRLVIIAVTPAIALALAFYLTDRFDREPMRLLTKVFVFGALSVIPIVIVGRFLVSLNIFTGLLGIAFTTFIIAGLTEEFFKREVVLRIAYKNPAFDEKLDGIIYAVFASLGFATVENIMYVLTHFSSNPYVGIYRGLLSVPAHALLGVTMGYYLSLAKFSINSNFERVYLRRALLVPAFLHGVFNFILMADISILLVLFIPYVIYLWFTNLKKLNHYYRESKTRLQSRETDYTLE
ncbi:MAG: peptidase [Gracilibacter sp. BRH_c7a]|nr:MAG: peptidase [Gracilibacter sp. BRH_c7a]